MSKRGEFVYLPEIWGPHYWFFLHTICMIYPHHPNDVMKRKYYDFINNLPIFIPIESHASEFSKMLDEYPVTPYLDNRKSLLRWVHYVHNKLNKRIEKPEIPYETFIAEYNSEYAKESYMQIYGKFKRLILFMVLLLILCIIIYVSR